MYGETIKKFELFHHHLTSGKPAQSTSLYEVREYHKHERVWDDSLKAHLSGRCFLKTRVDDVSSACSPRYCRLTVCPVRSDASLIFNRLKELSCRHRKIMTGASLHSISRNE